MVRLQTFVPKECARSAFIGELGRHPILSGSLHDNMLNGGSQRTVAIPGEIERQFVGLMLSST